MQKPLAGKVVGVLVANTFNEIQMADIQRTLSAQGAKIKILSNENGLVSGYSVNGWGLNFPVDAPIAESLSSDFDMVIALDGPKSIEKLMKSAHTKRIINGLLETQTPLVLLGDSVLLAQVFASTDGVVLAGTPNTKDFLGREGVKVSDDSFVISGNILSGNLDANNQDILEQIVFMASERENVAIAA